MNSNDDTVKYSFPPVIDAGCRVLILGSLPGEESLHQQQYYAHPRNGFWRVLAGVFAEPMCQSYPEKLAFLLAHRIALWDTVQCAVRPGSLDQHIRDPQPNDFVILFNKYPGLQGVAFNGSTAGALFNRLARPRLPDWLLTRLQFVQMPSTSPANPRPLEEKIARWRAILDLLKY